MLRFRTRTRKAPGGGGGGAPAGPSMSIGMNLGPQVSYSTNRALNNLVFSAERWQDSATNNYRTQDQGKLSGFTSADISYAMLAPNGEGLPTGTYTISNPDGLTIGCGSSSGPNYTIGSTGADGSGYSTATSLTFSYTAGNQLRLWVKGNVTNLAGTALGGLAVLMPGEAVRWGLGNYFTLDFENYHGGLGAAHFRFLDWNFVNVNLEEAWTDRCVMGKINFSGRNNAGMPWEIFISACNRYNKHMWINIPHRVSDAYVTSLATLINSTLNVGLQVWVEYGNEIWNYSGSFAGPTYWVQTSAYTKKLATVDAATGVFTYTAHGLTSTSQVMTWAHIDNRANGVDEGSYWETGLAGQNYAEMLTANTFRVRTAPSGGGTLRTFPTGVVKMYFIDMAEGGKVFANDADNVDRDVAYANRALAIVNIFDGIMGSSRVKAICGTQFPDTSISTTRLGVAGWAARTDYLVFAPYFRSYYFGAAADANNGSVRIKVWSNATTPTTFYAGVYTTGSTPRPDQIKAGTGTGYVGGVQSIAQTYASGGFTNGSATAIANGTYAVKILVQTPDGHQSVLTGSVTLAANKAGTSATSFSVGNGGKTFTTQTAKAFTAGQVVCVSRAANADVYMIGSVDSYNSGTGSLVLTVYDSQDASPAGPYTDWVIETRTEILDTFANQKTRALTAIDDPADAGLNLLNRAAAHKAIAVAANANIRIGSYEGGPHHDETMPVNIRTWMSSWMEDSTFGQVLTIYMNQAAAGDFAFFTYFSDCQNSLNWTLASSYTDITDVKYVAMAAFAGSVTKRTAVDPSTLVGTDITSDPASFPVVIGPFADSALTYTRMAGSWDDEENFGVSASGDDFVLNNDINVTWGSISSRSARVLATDGYTVGVFSVSFTLGNAWYASTQKFAWSTKTDTTPAAINPVSGNSLPLTGTAAVVVADGWDINDTAQYEGNHGNGALTYGDSPLFLFVARVDNENRGFRTLIRFGTPEYVQWLSSTLTQMQLDTSLFGTIVVPFDNTLGVHWIYFDHANLKYYYGRNQTVINAGGTTYAASGASSFSQYQVIGGNSLAVIAGAEACTAANLTAALAVVQKAQTEHSIA